MVHFFLSIHQGLYFSLYIVISFPSPKFGSFLYLFTRAYISPSTLLYLSLLLFSIFVSCVHIQIFLKQTFKKEKISLTNFKSSSSFISSLIIRSYFNVVDLLEVLVLVFTTYLGSYFNQDARYCLCFTCYIHGSLDLQFPVVKQKCEHHHSLVL